MLELRRLLKFTPDEAIIMMANSELNTYLRPEIVRVGEPTSLGGKLTQITIESIDKDYEMIQNPYVGLRTLEYSRYDLTEVFDQLIIDTKLPTTIGNILEYITYRTGILFDTNDFDNGVITESEFTLVAKAESKRWVGSVNVVVSDKDAGIHISQWLLNNRHDGLVTSVKEFIWDTFPKDILDGLELGKPFIGLLIRNNEHEGLKSTQKPIINLYVTRYEHDGLRIEPLVEEEEEVLPEGYGVMGSNGLIDLGDFEL